MIHPGLDALKGQWDKHEYAAGYRARLTAIPDFDGAHHCWRVGWERILSCLALAVQYEGRSVTTIEGLSTEGMLHPLQQAFIEHDGFQCGYCTPGQICSAVGMLGEVKRGLPSNVTGDLADGSIMLTRDELCERMSGNLCRCGAYNGIVDAITEFAETRK